MNLELIHNIQQIPFYWFWLIIFTFSIVSIAAFNEIVPTLNKAKLFRNTPISKIGSAIQAYVALSGKMIPFFNHEIRSPLSGTPCCLYQFKIEYEQIENKKTKWYEYLNGRNNDFFLLVDENGECILSPFGAEISYANEKVWTARQLPDQFQQLAQNKFPYNTKFRFTERIITSNNTIHLLGFFQTFNNLNKNIFTPDQLPEELRELLKFANTNQFLKQRFSQYERMDIDKLNQQWEEICKLQNVCQKKTINLIAVLKSNKKYPFLISSLPKEKIPRTYYQEAAMFGIVAVVLVICTVIGIVTRLFGNVIANLS